MSVIKMSAFMGKEPDLASQQGPAEPDDGLEPTAEGFRIRLRYGKGLRGRFLIRLLDRAAARRRAKRLRELAELLSRSGRSAEARLVLVKGGEVQNDRELAEVVKVANELCSHAAKQKRRERVVTFRDLGERWTRGDLAREFPDYVRVKKSVADDMLRLQWLYDRIGSVPLAGFSLDDAKRAMADIPKERSSATRRQYAQLISKVLKLAVFPCEIIDRSPLPPGFLPSSKSNKAKAWLYPAEDRALMANKEIPLELRVLFGFLAREGLRVGEALRLTWRDVDLAVGVVKLDENKTDDARAWKLDAGVVAALKAFKPEGAQGAQAIFAPEQPSRLARELRAALRACGIERAELFPNDTERKNRRQLRAHDLRGTFVTLNLANGKTETWIADRTGHKSSAMINEYRRAARTAAELDLGPLDSLVAAIPELAERPRPGPEGGPGHSEEAHQSAEGTKDSSLFTGVPKVGVEPTLHCWKRILRASPGDTDALDSGISAVSDTPGDTKKHGGPPLAQVGEGAERVVDVVEAALAEALVRASEAGEWEAVKALTAELEARRLG